MNSWNVPAAIAVAVTVALSLAGGAASAATSQPSAPQQGDFAGYQTEQDGTTLVNITSVTAHWIQPKVTVRSFHDAYSEVLAGLNDQNGTGAGNEQLMPQVGTEADSIGGKARYYAWYTPPHSANCGQNCQQYRFTNSVKPGDHMFASITVTSTDHYTIKLTDVRDRPNLPPLRWTQTVKFADPNVEVDLASVGVSTPSNSSNAVPLADFSTVHFTSVTVNGNVIGSYPYTVLNQWNYAVPDVLATSSAIGGSGGSFTATWKHAT
jgi:Peptidase A4 family